MCKDRNSSGLVATLLAFFILGASPLHAVAIDEVIQISESTPSNSDDLKTISVECPDGYSVMGGGFEVISGGNEQIAIGQSVPLDLPLEGWFAYAYETAPVAGSWSINVTANCIRSTGLVRVESESPSSDSDNKTASAECPGGMLALGGGGIVNGPFLATDVAIVGSKLDPGVQERAWRVRAQEVVSTQSAWSLSAVSICGHLSNRWALQDASVTVESERIELSVACPFDEQIISQGTELFGFPPATMTLRRIVANSPFVTAGTYESPTSTSAETSIISVSARCVELAVFADNFESEDTTAWSAAVD